MTERAPPAAPIAHHFRWSFCGECPNAHILFLDEHDRPIAQATMSLRQAIMIADSIRARDPNFRG